MEQQKVWRPHQGSQEIFLRLGVFEALYGGAAGGGKSDALLVDAARQMDKPNYRALILRRTFPELEKSLILRSFSLFADKYEWSSGEKRWHNRENRSFIEFGHLENESDVYKYQSSEYQFIGFDELTSFTEFQYLYMMSRIRGTDPEIFKSVRAATNPGNIGHVWVFNRFIDPQGQGNPEREDVALKKIYKFKRISSITELGKLNMSDQEIKIWKSLSTGLERTFIPATIFDNPTLMMTDPMYVARLQGLPEIERKRLLEGDWFISAGQFFKEWDFKKHVVYPFEIPTTWRKYRFIDFGRNAPFCCLWAAVDYDGNVYIYREYYQAGQDADVNAENVVKLSGNERYDYSIADAAIFSKTGHGETIAQIMARKGLITLPSSKDRIAGWNIVHSYLRSDGRVPKLRVFYNCQNLIRTLPQMIVSARNPEDIDSSGEDHAPDALRYGLQSFRDRHSPIPESRDSETIKEFNRKIGKVEEFSFNSFYDKS